MWGLFKKRVSRAELTARLERLSKEFSIKVEESREYKNKSDHLQKLLNDSAARIVELEDQLPSRGPKGKFAKRKK